MKKVLKLLLVVAPLLTDARLCATITAPSQLAPEVKVVLTPNFNPKGITAKITDSTNNVVNQIQRLSTDPITFDKPGLNLEIANNTILTPLVINDPKNFPKITIKKDALNTNSFYYIESVTVPSFNTTKTLKPFVDAIQKAIGDSNAVIYIEQFLFTGQTADKEQSFINSKATIDKDRGIVVFDQGKYDDTNGTYIKNPSIPTTAYCIGTAIPNDQNYKNIIADRTLQGIKQADQEKLDVNETTKTNTSYKAKLQALNDISRLKGITDPATLNSNDKYTIKKAITDYLKLVGNKADFPDGFLLQFNSTELQALSDSLDSVEKDFGKKNESDTSVVAQFNLDISNKRKTIGEMKNYKALQEDLANRLALDQQQSGDGTAVVDWYMNLNSGDQLLMEYDIKAVYDQEHILNMDPNLLNDAERAEVRIYINDLLTRSKDAAQKADLQAKIKAIDAVPADAQKLQDLQTKLQTYSDPKQENAMIDWIATLSAADQQSINEDVQAILVANTFTEAYNSYATQKGNKTSIKEVFQLKQTLEGLLQDPEQELDPILDKAIVQFKTKGGSGWITNTTTLSDDMAQSLITQKINRCADTIQNLLLDHIEKNGDITSAYANLFNFTNTSDYAIIFRKLSLQEQKSVFDNIGQRDDNIPTKDKVDAKAKRAQQLADYQKATLPERIQETGTTAQLQALEDDVKKVNINLDANTEKLFSNKFSLVETAENEAIAKGEPFIPEAKPTDAIIFDQITGQNVQIDNATGEVIPVPAGGTTDSADAAAEQAEIAQDDPDLAKQDKEEEAKEAAAEQARKDAAKDADNYNQEHAAEGVQEIK